MDWYELLGEATRSASPTTDINDTIRIAEFWLAHFDAVVVSCNVTGLYVRDMDNFINFTLTNNLVEILAAQKDHAEKLAWLCVARASLVEYNAALPAGGGELAMLLKQWLKREVPTAATTTMRGMIDLVYGPAVWVLYCADVEYLSTLPQHLYTLGLPVNVANNQSSIAINIPDNI